MAANCYISASNLLAAAGSVSFTNKDASTAGTNLCDGKLATVVRAASAGATLTIDFDLTTAKSIRGLLLAGINWPASTSLTWNLSNTSVSGTDVLNNVSTPTIPTSRAQVMINLSAALSARYGRIIINPPGSEIVEVGWAWLARADFAPAIGFQPGIRFAVPSRTLVQMTQGGVPYTDYIRPLAQWQIGFRHLTAAEAMETALDMDVDRDVRKPVLFVPHRNNTNTNLNREALLATFAQLDPVENWAYSQYAKSYLLRECLAADETVSWS